MANTVKKPTKKANYSAIKSILDAAESAGISLEIEGISYESLAEFVEHEIELLDNKAAAAQKRAADKKVEGDALRERIYNVLSDSEFMTIPEIVKALNDEDISAQMVTARLTQLMAPEVAKIEKEMVTVPAAIEGGKAKKLSAYRKIG